MYGMLIYKWETGRGRNTAGKKLNMLTGRERNTAGKKLNMLTGRERNTAGKKLNMLTGRGRNTAGKKLNMLTGRERNTAGKKLNMLTGREKYCRLMDEGIECSITNAEQFGCPQSLYDFLRYSSYIRLPTECQKPNTTNYKWLQLYTELPTTLNSTAELTADTGTNSSTAINVSFFLVVVGALLNARLY
ncbi:unnamed protein product [Mytilus edulis]|uniref:Uncharacterized protein n=1 Tax=Mytilus edulis TaxID=6550 RepID=A0A8S3TZJ4_MYTED|nr:unnamed protein product [Mytilus edulis]